jgi:hypothetical protein
LFANCVNTAEVVCYASPSMNVHAIYLVLVSAIPIAGLITNVFGVMDKVIAAGRWVLHKVRPANAPGTQLRIPNKTVIAMIDPRDNSQYWAAATVADQPGYQLVGDFNATNIWDGPVRLLVGLVRYRRWFFLHKVVKTNPLVRDTLSGMVGRNVIRPGDTALVRMVFIFREAKVLKVPRSFAADVGFVDQFNNHHWLRGLQFKHASNEF